MSAPERIWAVPYYQQSWANGEGWWSETAWHPDSGPSEYISVTALSSAPEVQELIREAVEAEREHLQSDRPFIMGANHGYDTAMDQVVDEARRFAEMYPQSSDGRNTFEIFADWARRMKDGPAFDAAIRGTKP